MTVERKTPTIFCYYNILTTSSRAVEFFFILRIDLPVSHACIRRRTCSDFSQRQLRPVVRVEKTPVRQDRFPGRRVSIFLFDNIEKTYKKKVISIKRGRDLHVRTNKNNNPIDLNLTRSSRFQQVRSRQCTTITSNQTSTRFTCEPIKRAVLDSVICLREHTDLQWEGEGGMGFKLEGGFDDDAMAIERTRSRKMT